MNQVSPIRLFGIIIMSFMLIIGLSACQGKYKDTDKDCYTDKVEKMVGTDPKDPKSTPPDKDGDCISDAEEATMDGFP